MYTRYQSFFHGVSQALFNSYPSKNNDLEKLGNHRHPVNKHQQVAQAELPYPQETIP